MRYLMQLEPANPETSCKIPSKLSPQSATGSSLSAARHSIQTSAPPAQLSGRKTAPARVPYGSTASTCI